MVLYLACKYMRYNISFNPIKFEFAITPAVRLGEDGDLDRMNNRIHFIMRANPKGRYPHVLSRGVGRAWHAPNFASPLMNPPALR